MTVILWIRNNRESLRMETHIRPLESRDIPEITTAFEEIGWNKPVSQYKIYLAEQEYRLRDVYLALWNGQFAGYLTISWKSSYEPFRMANIPEITDFNVLPKFRRLGIGSQLMNKAEAVIVTVSSIAGIGVGLTPDYGAAQRLYVLRGYIPDGRGVQYRHHPIQFGQELRVGDDLVLYLTKDLR